MHRPTVENTWFFFLNQNIVRYQCMSLLLTHIPVTGSTKHPMSTNSLLLRRVIVNENCTFP